MLWVGTEQVSGAIIGRSVTRRFSPVDEHFVVPNSGELYSRAEMCSQSRYQNIRSIWYQNGIRCRRLCHEQRGFSSHFSIDDMTWIGHQ